MSITTLECSDFLKFQIFRYCFKRFSIPDSIYDKYMSQELRTSQYTGLGYINKKKTAFHIHDALKKMRQIDDKIVYALNSIVPTESFRNEIDATKQCQGLYEQLEQGHLKRENYIKGCVSYTADNLKILKVQREKDLDINLNKQLKEEQTKLRLFQMELSVEEIIRQRSDKVFYEKCRSYFTPNKS